MEEEIKHIEKLESLSKKLEPSADDRNHWSKSVLDFLHQYIDVLDDHHSYKKGRVQPKKQNFEQEEKIEDLLVQLKEYFDKGITASSGGHLGYIPGGGLYAAGMGDLIAAITNEYAGMEFGSPGAVAIENELLNWMIRIFKFPENSVGNLTSGGSIANLIALTAARDTHEVINERVENSVIYLSEQVHHCVNKALRIIGLGSAKIHYIPLDSSHRMDVVALENKINEDRSQNLNPFLVIASAGTTDTGALDPLGEIGALCQSEKLWYHIDAAYGGFFILTDEKKQVLSDISLADSLVIDPHKGLFLPYGLGAVLVKDQNAVLHSHHYIANYMEGAYEEATNYSPADLSPELTKHFRGLRMWLALKLHGIEPFKAGLSEKLYLAGYFMKQIKKRGFMTGPQPDFSVGYFYYPTEEKWGIDEEKFNKKMYQFMLEDGSIFFSTTTIQNKWVIRIAVLSFRTHLSTIQKGIEMIDQSLKKTISFYGLENESSNE